MRKIRVNDPVVSYYINTYNNNIELIKNQKERLKDAKHLIVNYKKENRKIKRKIRQERFNSFIE